MTRFEGESAEDYEARMEIMVGRRVAASGLPAGLCREVELVGHDVEAREAAQAWASGAFAGLVLTGTVGAGKTTLAAKAFRERLGEQSGYWRTMPALMHQLSAGFGTPELADAQRVLAATRMLGLDDLDKTRPNDAAAERVFAAIDNAIVNERPLIVTTNVTLGELSQHWPERWARPIASRLAGYCQVMKMTSPDRRLG